LQQRNYSSGKPLWSRYFCALRRAVCVPRGTPLFGSASFRVIIQQNEHTQTVIINRRKKCTCSSYSFVTLHGGVRLLCLSTTREMRFLCLAQRSQGSYRLISRSCITLSWLNVNFFSKIIIRNDYLCRAHYGVTYHISDQPQVEHTRSRLIKDYSFFLNERKIIFNL